MNWLVLYLARIRPPTPHFRATRWHISGICLRRLHESNLEAGRVTFNDKARRPVTTSRARFAPRQVTISFKKPDKVTLQDVLNALAPFTNSPKTLSSDGRRKSGGAQCLYILATPTFAAWLEASSEFIPKLLHEIVGTAAIPIEVEVVCACVDGLSPPLESLNNSETLEGFSIRHCTKLANSPGYDGFNAKTRSPTTQSTLTFSSVSTDANTKFKVTLPLANTLFKNSRQSTLLHSRWISSGTSFQINSEQTEIVDINLAVFARLKDELPCSHIPAVPLTPLRRIENGLGNIVRRIDFGKGNIGPASRELEKSVTEYLGQQGQTRSTVGVWALVIPKEAATQSYRSVDLDLAFVARWISRGAILCRVLSGGGGWGAKEGLLSLDPQTTYDTINESRFDFSSGSLEEQQASALGNLAQEGGFIQFLVADSNKWPSDSLERKDHADSTRKSVVIGVVPSTIDDIPVRSETKPLDEAELKTNVKIWLGHFGCVSESGMFVHHPNTFRSGDLEDPNAIQNRSPIDTKIDLPYSYMYQTYSTHA